MADRRDSPRNWDQARTQIDRGGAGDKIARPDPAAAPLGTDAEAGGAATAPDEIARSARPQMQGGPARAAARAPLRSRGRHVPWLVVALALAAAVAAALLVV